MAEIIQHRSSISRHRRGVALLMVLIIVLAVTIIATGFIARTDVELASGGNMLLRTQMDQLADSALEHARGLLLCPQDASGSYWTGGQDLQLLDGSPDYYDVNVAPGWTAATEDRCTYDITCEAYRMRNGEKTGSSRLWAVLRLDPCIGLWTKGDTTFRQNWILHGDMRTQGGITNEAPPTSLSLDGDVFTTQPFTACVGQRYDYNDVSLGSLSWPPVDVDYLTPPTYYSCTDLPSDTLSGNPGAPRIWRRIGDHPADDLTLKGAAVEGMLLVKGNLTIAGSGSSITAAKNLPALYVGGDLVLEDANGLTVTGLAVVKGNLRVHAGASNVRFTGGLCLGGTITETTPDASGNGHTGLLRGHPSWTGGVLGRALRFHGVGDYVDAGVDPNFDLPNAITVTAWVEPNDAGDHQHHPYVTKGDHTYGLKHRHLPEDPADYFEFFIYDGTWQSARVEVNATFNDGWHHLAGTYDGSEIKLYVDGVLQATTPHAGTIGIQAGHALRIGGNCERPDRGYDGAIDDVRIYNCALDAATIGQVQAGQAVTAGLVGRWTLAGPGSGVTIVADPMQAAIVAWPYGINRPPVCWSPAAGAFFRRIARPTP